MPETIETDADAIFAEMQGAEASEEKPTESQETTPDKYKIGDEELTKEEIQEALATSRQAKELEKGAREKFDEAAALRKQLAVEAEDLANMRTIWNAWQSGDKAMQGKLLSELAEEAGMTVAQVKSELEDFNPDDLTTNENRLYRQNQALKNRLDQLEGKLTHLDGTVKAVVPALEEIRKYADSEKEAKQIQADIAAIKQKTGQDISGEQIKTWRDNGITDPVKAIDVLAPMLQKATQEGANKARTPGEAPDTTQSNTFDPNDPDMDPDEMLARLRKGEIPIG